MLESITIKNFRSCGDVELNGIAGMTTLIGRNSTGKTNILKAIEWAAKTATSSNHVDEGMNSQPNSTTEFIFLINLEGDRYRYVLDVTFSKHIVHQYDVLDFKCTLNECLEVYIENEFTEIIKRQSDKVKVEGWDTNIDLEEDIPCLKSIIKLLPKVKVRRHIDRLVLFLGSINYYPLDELNGRINQNEISTDIVKHSDYIKWLSRVKTSGTPARAISMRLLHMFLNSEEDFNEVKDLLGPKGLGVLSNIFINIPRILGELDEGDDTSEKFYLFRFSPYSEDSGSDERSFGFNDLSFGTRRLIRIVVSLIYDKSSIFLIEQPEDGIHPELLHKLIPLIRSYSDKAQFIIASHSPEVLNRLEASEIRLITMNRGLTNARKLTSKELSVVSDYISEEGTLSDFLDSIQED